MGPLFILFYFKIIFNKISATDPNFNHKNDLVDNSTHPSHPKFKKYLTFCPCHGRLGNQLDQFLGSIAFAKLLNRSILMPRLNYGQGNTTFSEIFDLDVLNEVLPGSLDLGTAVKCSNGESCIWPVNKRIITCHHLSMAPRQNSTGSNKNHCQIFKSQPSKYFWESYGITAQNLAKTMPWTNPNGQYVSFDSKFKYHFDNRFGRVKVLAFSHPPASYPSKSEDLKFSEYLVFSKKYLKLLAEFQSSFNFSSAAYLAVHLRLDSDMARVCQDLPTQRSSSSFKYMSSGQCNYKNLYPISKKSCLPDLSLIVGKIFSAVKNYQENFDKSLKVIFVGLDYNDKLRREEFKYQLEYLLNEKFESDIESDIENKIKVVMPNKGTNPMMDLLVMSYSDHFIGSCISSFTHFVRKYRQFVLDRDTEYFGVPYEKDMFRVEDVPDGYMRQRRSFHDEL